MINLDEQLKQLPGEFVVEMEKQKTDRWEDVYQFILEYFDLSEAMKEAEKENIELRDFLKKIHDFGFYGGVNFALDPQSPYEKKSST